MATPVAILTGCMVTATERLGQKRRPFSACLVVIMPTTPVVFLNFNGDLVSTTAICTVIGGRFDGRIG